MPATSKRKESLRLARLARVDPEAYELQKAARALLRPPKRNSKAGVRKNVPGRSPDPVMVPCEAGGLRLHLSSANSSGYLYVKQHGARFMAYKPSGRRGEGTVFLATYATATEAAVRVAEEIGGALVGDG